MLMRLKLISITKFNTSWFAVYLQKTLHFLVFQWNIGLKTSKHEFSDRIHQNKQGFEGKKLSGKEFLGYEVYQRVCVEDMAGSANCTQRFFILFSYLNFCFSSSRILQNNLLRLYLVKIRRHKLSFFAKPQQTPRSIYQFSNRSVKLGTHRGLGLAKSICAPNLETTGSNAKFGSEAMRARGITVIVKSN